MVWGRRAEEHFAAGVHGKKITGNVAKANTILLWFFLSLNLGSTPRLKLSFLGKGACQRVGGLNHIDPNFYRALGLISLFNKEYKTHTLFNIVH